MRSRNIITSSEVIVECCYSELDLESRHFAITSMRVVNTNINRRMNMKKTLVSLAAVAALTTGAMAADKGIDIKTTGQAVVYYNTLGNNAKDGADLFSSNGDNDNTRASYGIQLNLDADLKNGFTFGSTINYLGTLGLEKNAVNGTMQNVNGSTAKGSTTVQQALQETGIDDDIYLAQIYIAKKMGNTTLKLGRQELPKSLSPFAFSEGWNVFKNTFDAILVVNTDIPDTAIVGAYVAKGNGNGFGNNMSSFTDLVTSVTTRDTTTGKTGTIKPGVEGTAYMLTVQNKSIPLTTITASYYDLAKIGQSASSTGHGGIGANVIWADVLVAGKDMPLGMKIGVQGGQVSPDSKFEDFQTKGNDVKFADTTAYGIKFGMKPVDMFSFCLAYTSVDGDDKKANVAVKNTTGVKTPLYTQMVANQDWIALDSDTIMAKFVLNTGDFGKIILQGSQSNVGESGLTTYNNSETGKDIKGNDLLDIELLYKVKAAGINWLAAYISQDFDKDKGTKNATHNDIVRFVARYNF